ncbi:MAG: ABC transporter ATP-binding protein [Acidobacteria bacterium]|nr:MAG: ABC transporter ATP-binding protein [Acidobacteriota bacterium]REK01910.1 MAG: ABC transporter ATP-binding protein [Acidobacteriota bacterium]REK14866.1 MAG: ABC transporter ATP-binding protein [Acidobacteriota bacterium]REK45581.1 MAG: ABC transporter ATP-binding protein [Acidobacteriota bacterium]
MPSEEKKKKVTFKGAWQDARELLWAHRYRLALGGGLMLVSRLAGLVLPASTKFLVDEVIAKERYEVLTWIAFAIGAATVVQAITSFALSQILGVAAQRAITEMRKKVQARIERLPVSYFDSTQSGQLISRIMSDAEGIRNLIGTGLVQLSGSTVTALISIGVLFWLNWRMTAITILVLAAFGGALAYAFKRLRPIFRERQQINAEVTGRLGESLGGIRIVKAYTAEKREELTFAKGAHRLFRNVAKSMTGVSAMSGFSSVIVGAIGVVMILVGGNAVMAGSMTLGDLVMYIFFTGLMALPIIEFTSIGTQITEAFAGLDRIREVFRSITEDEEDLSKRPLPTVRGDVEFVDVYFEYEEGTPVLNGVSFSAKAGMTTALVGSSGSGKSTILAHVMNFVQAKKGKVLIDGYDIREVRLRDYRRQLGVVLQEDFLFDGTILENIRFSNTSATLDDVKEVCRIAYCDEFIEKFENGYDTVVGERGVKLSGGQRQRIAIARALLADPRILILDEATSSLDSESEQMIQEGLHSLRRGRTTFVIAHRLSTIQTADQILVVEDGLIVESGKHDELIALGGRYKELYDKQYRYEMNRFINPGEDFTTNARFTASTDSN